MKYIDLFAGIGGFHYGIDRAIETQEERVWQECTEGLRSQENKLQNEGLEGLGGSTTKLQQHSIESTDRQFTCVYSNEWDKYANSVYRKHFGECDNRDIRTVKASEIPDHDLLVGGFPCQAFSVAGKRGGFNDTRGTLFFEIARILSQKQPRLCLLENVKGLLSHDQGRTFEIILASLDELGYDAQWQVLNSKNFGVPQNRERVFIVGHLRGTPRPKVFPIGEADGDNSQQTEKLSEPISNCLRTNYSNGKSNETYIRQLNNPTHSNDRVYGDNGIAPTLNTMQGGRRQPKIAIPVLTPDRPEKRQNGRRMKTNGEPSFTLTGQDIHGVFNGTQIRRLTPTECERLQGFEDGWTEFGANGEKISDTQRYKMCGNAVTTNVVTEIVKKLAGRTE